jgi:hypothetical protein
VLYLKRLKFLSIPLFFLLYKYFCSAYSCGGLFITIPPMTNKKAQARPNAKSPLCKATPQMALDPPMNAPFTPSFKGLLPGFGTGTTGLGSGHTLKSSVPAGTSAACTGVAVYFTNKNIEYIERETFIPF